MRNAFVVRQSHRNLPDERLLEDLQRVAKIVGGGRLSRSQYDRHGLLCSDTFCNRFGRWSIALQLAGLTPGLFRDVTAGELVQDIQRVMQLLNVERLSGAMYHAHGRYSRKIIDRLFGNWPSAARAAGVRSVMNRPLDEDALLDDLAKLWRKLQRQPKSEEIGWPNTRFSMTLFRQRFGSCEKALLALQQRERVDAPADAVRISKHRRTPRHVNDRLRYQVLQRDHFRCCACGRSPANDPGVKLVIDHKIPWSRGGQTVLENLQTLCEQCNGGKGNL